jgi:signal transduction histidine kinase
MVQNLTEILQNFLSIDQLEQEQIDTQQAYFDLRLFLSELIEGLDALKKDGQQIQWNFKGEELVLMDKKILRNILVNLLSNAIKYSEQDIEMHVKASPKEINIRIRDYGIGIPAEQHEHLFGKFFRAENALTIKGTGLGLHIVKHYLKLLNGSIHFESQVGQGTTFFLNLPSKPGT